MFTDSSITVPTQFVKTPVETYVYRRFGAGPGLPLLCLAHFTGTLDNWDPAVVDALASEREVVLFESAGIGRSTGTVPASVPEMARHAFAFVAALGYTRLDLLGFSLGGMVAQQMVTEKPEIVRKMILAATAPEGGEDIMHLDAPELKSIFATFSGYERLARLFFTQSEAGIAAGEAFVRRHSRTTERSRAGRPGGCVGADRGVSRLGALRRGTLRETAADRAAMLSRERRTRRHDSRKKLVHAGRASAERDPDRVSRCRPRVAVSVQPVVCGAGADVLKCGSAYVARRGAAPEDGVPSRGGQPRRCARRWLDVRGSPAGIPRSGRPVAKRARRESQH